MDKIITEGPIYSNNTGLYCPKCGYVVSPKIDYCEKSDHDVVYKVTNNSYTTTTWDTNGLQSNEQMIFS